MWVNKRSRPPRLNDRIPQPGPEGNAESSRPNVSLTSGRGPQPEVASVVA
jgi:hypothetical protein